MPSKSSVPTSTKPTSIRERRAQRCMGYELRGLASRLWAAIAHEPHRLGIRVDREQRVDIIRQP